MNEVALRLSEETARDLWDLIYMYGEHIAAGGAMVGMGGESDERLSRIMHSIDAQLGRQTMYGEPAPSPDTIL
jgi:hypothetical protein